MQHFTRRAATALLIAGAASLASAQTKDLTIGVILPMSGSFAAHGKQIKHGIDLYMASHGDTVAGRKIKLIVKDDTGIAPPVAKRHAQELLVNDKVDILAGFSLTPNAFAAAPVATQGNVPMVVLNAATSSITEKSPNIVRVSMTLPQNAMPMARWAWDNGIKSAYTMVTDYGPGHDAEKQFQKTFQELGGKIVGSVRTPVNTPDYSPFLQRVLDAKPDAAFFFVPNGEDNVALAKGIKERGLEQAGVKAIATGDVTDEEELAAMGDAALGMITSYHYSQAHDSPENKAFVAAYTKAYPKDRPNFMAVAGYDGVQMIYQALEKTKGDASAPAFMAAVKGMKWMSPRGPVQIDPETRDIVQNVYIRKVEKVGGVLQNVEFARYEAVKDPGKSAK
ncbi:MAG: ABC transporter substrate-binding protein [Comamonas sp. SCN 65-56]|uniref:ABC transporter substrate-binding protein n=1 Tax=Comamonas sp. SCN 65-56 TaxID=1660095 RepID=UPI00086F5098|nr:ABC transporter substrate-binding protein [Comamonas sp. SCN 65-56]ODS91726.1 MAG: ABC transporter substrate-binding protein [Comamonas sp. SCN 65-56]